MRHLDFRRIALARGTLPPPAVLSSAMPNNEDLMSWNEEGAPDRSDAPSPKDLPKDLED